MGELIITGDRVLIEPMDGEQTTKAGLVLPSTVAESDQVRSGRVVKVGPGYLTANPEFSEGRPWVERRDAVRYLPLQAEPGDYAFYVRREGIDLKYEGKKYVIVQHHAIVALMRPDSSDVLEKIEGLLGGM